MTRPLLNILFQLEILCYNTEVKSADVILNNRLSAEKCCIGASQVLTDSEEPSYPTKHKLLSRWPLLPSPFWLDGPPV